MVAGDAEHGQESCSSVSVDRLLSEFRMFRQAAEALESAYRDLKGRAAEVDQKLAAANRALTRGLSEREQILESLPIGVFKRTDGVAEAANTEARRLEELLGDSLPQCHPKSNVGGAAAHEVEVEDRNGRTRTLRLQRVPLQESDCCLEFVEDQTTLVELRREINRLDRLSSLAELALGIAHEVRNPLNGLAGFAGLLRRQPNSPKVEEWAVRIEEGALRIDRIIGDLLAFARPEQQAEVVARPLREWIDEASSEAGLSVDLDATAAAVSVLGHPRALGNVFSNLLRNAKEAGATRVRVTTELADNRVCVQVEDNGPGVASALRDRLFDPFVGSKESGSGLGLAFCARAVEAMGGRIRLLPSDAGACFELELMGVRESIDEAERTSCALGR